MGLRTSSEWDTKPMGNVPGMTPRQESMSTARSPMAGQDMNEVKAPKAETGNVRSQQEQEKAGVQKEQKKQEASSSKAGQAQAANPTSQAVEQIASRMGNFGYTLRAKVNQFLSGRAQSSGFASGDATFKNGVLSVTQGAATLDPLVREKQQQQEDIRSTLSPFAKMVGGKMQIKTFSEAAAQELKDNPEVSSILQTVAALQDLKARGLSGSPEAIALEEQIAQQDKFGMVSQLRDAMSEYNRLMGIDEANEVMWYGGSMADLDKTKKGYSAIDLAELGGNELRTELEKSQAFTSGMFSGDFEENLKKMIDTESAENKANAARASQLNTELYSAFNAFKTSAGADFEKERKSIEGKMNAAAQTVRTAMMLTPEGREGLQWFDALLQGSNGDMSKMLFQALNNPNMGLGRDQRDAIRNFLGEVGASSGKIGQLAMWMDQLGNTGKLQLKNAQGVFEDVEPSATQKLQMMDILADTSTTPAQKQESMQKLVRSIGIDAETNIGKSVDAALTTAKNTGSMDLALGAFTASLTASLQTFAGSRTADAVMQALGMKEDQWNTVQPGYPNIHDQHAAYIREALMKNPNLAETLRGQISAKQAADQETFNKTIQNNRDTAKKTLETIDGLLNGVPAKTVNGVTTPAVPSITQRKETILAARNALPVNLASKLMAPMQAMSTRASSYLAQIQRNPVMQSRLAGKTGVAEKLAGMFSLLDTAKSLGASYPAIAEAIYPGWSSANPADMTRAVMGPGIVGFTTVADRLLKNFELYSTAQDGKPSQKLVDAVTANIDQWKNNPNSRGAMGSAIMTQMDLADNQISQLDGALAKANAKKTEITANLATMDKMVQDMKIPTFNPDDILNGVMGMSRGLENILNGKGIEGLDLTPDNLATILPGLLSPQASDPAAIPETIKKMLGQLGLPIEAWTIKNGIPAIRMGDGKFIPVGSAQFANLAASMGYSPDALPTDLANFNGLGDVGYTPEAQDMSSILPAEIVASPVAAPTPPSEYQPSGQEAPETGGITNPHGILGQTMVNNTPRNYNDNLGVGQYDPENQATWGMGPFSDDSASSMGDTVGPGDYEQEQDGGWGDAYGGDR